MSNSENIYWVMYHLTAIKYSSKGIDKKLDEFRFKNVTKGLVSELYKEVEWYKNHVEKHRKMAMGHIPESERKKWEKQIRKIENECYTRIYLEKRDIDEKDFDLEFKTAKEYLEEGD